MTSTMLLSALLCLLLCWMLPVDSMRLRVDFTLHDAKKPLKLSMAEDAVDDMYFGCDRTMSQLVKSKYFEKEKKGTFKEVWKNAEKCANKKLKEREAGDEALTKEHMQAICVYTSDEDEDDDDDRKGFYKTFNDAVRTNRMMYGKGFPFYSLYFWLTSAVQILNNNNQTCHLTYRRTSVDFTGKKNKMMRFGSFASSSYKTTLEHFGNKTCFKIKTCAGAFLKQYSQIKKEEEVLIPPYEVFRITEIKKGRDVRELVDCQVVYMLQSVGLLSNLNCKTVKV